jgi:tRNA A37 threonylcarbamoyladenosine dehydratase
MSNFEEKFGSLSRVYGDEVFSIIRASHICIVGVGGVGSWVAEALVRSGVGKITLVDGDTVSNSNMNRQIHTLDASIGLAKTEVMLERMQQINAECIVKTINEYMHEKNLRDILLRDYQETDFDGVIDAIDNIKVKSAMIYCCKRNKIPIITTGGAGGLTDPAKIEIKDLSRTWNDPLAAAVRLRLRQQHNFARNLKRSFGVPCVYSTQQQCYPDKDGKPGFSKPGVAGLSLDCNYGYGSSVMVTASFGFAAAAKMIDILVKKNLPNLPNL